MQSRLYINGREVQNPVARGFAATLVLGILGLIFLALGILFLSVIGLGLAIGAGVAGIGLGALAVRRAITGKQERTLPPAERPMLGEGKEEA